MWVNLAERRRRKLSIPATNGILAEPESHAPVPPTPPRTIKIAIILVMMGNPVFNSTDFIAGEVCITLFLSREEQQQG